MSHVWSCRNSNSSVRISLNWHHGKTPIFLHQKAKFEMAVWVNGTIRGLFSLGMVLQMQVNFCHLAEVSILLTSKMEFYINASHKCYYPWCCKDFLFSLSVIYSELINSPPSFKRGFYLFYSRYRLAWFHAATATDIKFSDFLLLYQISFSTQVKRSLIISKKHGIYELPHELPNELRLNILGN